MEEKREREREKKRERSKITEINCSGQTHTGV